METPLDVRKAITRQDVAKYAGDVLAFMSAFYNEDSDLERRTISVGPIADLPGRKIQGYIDNVPVLGRARVISCTAKGIGEPIKLEIGLEKREVTIVLNCNDPIAGYDRYGNPNRAGHIHQSRRLEGRGVAGAREGLEYLASLA